MSSEFIASAVSSLFATSVLLGQNATTATTTAAPSAIASDCASKAIGTNGKPLAGAAKASFVKKCVADAKGGK